MTLLPVKDRKLKSAMITIPSDISSAAFFIVGALIVPGSKLILKNVGVNPSRTGLLDALIKMGGKITLKNKKIVSGEPVADIVVESSKLKAVDFAGDDIVTMIDEIPILSVAAAYAAGVTTISNAEELRVKESDRIKSVCGMLKSFGVNVQEKPDGMIIKGDPELKVNHVVKVDSHYDHRIAMSAAIMALNVTKDTIISHDKSINTSFPSFIEFLLKVSK
jgi:3-phosphoshikimate 1-carboxyvinyltransferase